MINAAMCVIENILANFMPLIAANNSGNGGWERLILSGLAGAIIAQVMAFWYAAHRRRQEYHGLLRGIVAECKYCERVTKEVVDGTLKGGSFKRLPIDYFKGARENSVKYKMSKELVDALAAACADLKLLNLEADYVFDGRGDSRNNNGNISSQGISLTISSAQEGVLGTLKRLKGAALKELNVEEEEEDEDYD